MAQQEEDRVWRAPGAPWRQVTPWNPTETAPTVEAPHVFTSPPKGPPVAIMGPPIPQVARAKRQPAKPSAPVGAVESPTVTAPTVEAPPSEHSYTVVPATSEIAWEDVRQQENKLERNIRILPQIPTSINIANVTASASEAWEIWCRYTLAAVTSIGGADVLRYAREMLCIQSSAETLFSPRVMAVVGGKECIDGLLIKVARAGG